MDDHSVAHDATSPGRARRPRPRTAHRHDEGEKYLSERPATLPLPAGPVDPIQLGTRR